MSTALPESHRLPNIDARAWEHPADRAATTALKSVPMLDTVVRKLIELGYERAYRQSMVAYAVKLGDDQLNDVYNLHLQAARILDVPDVPPLYLGQHPIPNALTFGSKNPTVMLHSSIVDQLGDEELLAVLGHEAGHILGDHVLYSTALQILIRLTAPGLGLPIFMGLPLLGVKYALLEWFRAAELSCDRAAALTVRDPMPICRTLMVMAGGQPSTKLNVDAFIRQAADEEEWSTGWDRLSRMRRELGSDYPSPVRRVREVMKWVQSGDYDRIVSGDYIKRDAPPRSVREDSGEMVDYYAEKFRQGFKEAGDAVGKIADTTKDSVGKVGETVADGAGKLAEWLRGKQNGSND